MLLGFPLEYDVENIKRKLGDEVIHIRSCTVVRDNKRLPTRNVALMLDRVSFFECLSLSWLG